MRRNSVYFLGVLGGAVFIEHFLVTGIDSVWKTVNHGVSFFSYRACALLSLTRTAETVG
jgi:hypothetical protein